MPPLQAERAAPERRTDIKKTAAAAHANLLDDFCNEICQQRKKLLGPLVSDVCGGTPSSIVGEDIAVTVAKSLNHLIGPLEQSRRDHQPALSDPRSTYRPTAHIPPSPSNERSLGVTLKIAA